MEGCLGYGNKGDLKCFLNSNFIMLHSLNPGEILSVDYVALRFQY
jgi:hypothetical protein